MERENGYYWVKFEGKWTILKWNVDCWWGGEYTFTDNDFEAIDDRRLIDPEQQGNCNKHAVSNNEVAVCYMFRCSNTGGKCDYCGKEQWLHK